jgi:hypothetical protein
MNEPSNRRLRWGYLAIFAVLALIACVIFLLQRKDSEVAEAIDKLQPGMTAAEVQEILKPVHHFEMPRKQGTSESTFYALDGFLTIVMEKDGDNARLTRVVHQPDGGPWWERLRRKWESRLR